MILLPCDIYDRDRVDLSATELAEICFMANHDAIDVLAALRHLGLRHGVDMTAADLVRGGL